MNRFDATTAAARKTITLFLTLIFLTRTITSFYQSSLLSSPSFITDVPGQSISNLLDNKIVTTSTSKEMI